MADMPMDTTLIDNPLSAAPGFILENVHVLPGVPSILQAMFEGLSARLPGGVVMTGLRSMRRGEGGIATLLADVQAAHDGISIGSYPWFKPGNFERLSSSAGLMRLSPDRRRRRSPQR